MTDSPNDAVPEGLADLPLDDRRAKEIRTEREIADGMTRRHVAIAADERAFAAVHFDRLRRAGPALAAKLGGK